MHQHFIEFGNTPTKFTIMTLKIMQEVHVNFSQYSKNQTEVLRWNNKELKESSSSIRNLLEFKLEGYQI